MRRKALLCGFACCFVASIFWLARSAFIKSKSWRVGAESQDIVEGPQRKDEIVVMARVESEDVN